MLGDQDFRFYNTIRVLQPTLTALAYLALWRLDEFTVGSALLAHLPRGAAVVRCRDRAYPAPTRLGRPSAALMRSTLWYGARAHGANVGGVVNARLDLLIIPAFLAASSVGLYAVAIAATSVIPIIAGALSALVLPRAARQGAAGSRGP